MTDVYGLGGNLFVLLNELLQLLFRLHSTVNCAIVHVDKYMYIYLSIMFTLLGTCQFLHTSYCVI